MEDDRVSGVVHFVVTDQALLVANDGKPFDADRIRSITRLNSSDELGRRLTPRQVGYKGIGFTSVFEVSERPQVLSRDVGSSLDRQAATELVRSHLRAMPDGPIPACYFPLPVSVGDLGDDVQLVAGLFAAGAATVIRLPLRGDRPYDDVLAHVRQTLSPERLLFLPAVAGLIIEDRKSRTRWARREASRAGRGRIVHLESGQERRSWLIARRRVPVSIQRTQRICR